MWSPGARSAIRGSFAICGASGKAGRCRRAPELAEQRQVMLEHLDRVLQGYPEQWGIGYFRKFMIYYARRHPKRKQVVLALIKAKTRVEVEAGINTWYGEEGKR